MPSDLSGSSREGTRFPSHELPDSSSGLCETRGQPTPNGEDGNSSGIDSASEQLDESHSCLSEWDSSTFLRELFWCTSLWPTCGEYLELASVRHHAVPGDLFAVLDPNHSALLRAAVSAWAYPKGEPRMLSTFAQDMASKDLARFTDAFSKATIALIEQMENGEMVRASLASYMRQLLRRRLVDEFFRKPQTIEATSLWSPDIVEAKSNEQIAREDREELERGISRLRPFPRLLIRLFYFEEWTYEEIANTLNLPIGTVKKQLFLARIELRLFLNPDDF
jgi:RNA polymerase sigma factor (sigma-70 family)